MNIKVQMGMVLNLDKCLACHTCSIPCKNAWTTAPGTEYMWFNNVETKPGVGYPKEWENQDRYKGGWEIRDGKLHLRAGGKTDKLANIFANPDLPALDDYYEPWKYDYERLTDSPASRHQPVARPHSAVTGKAFNPQWGSNWEDDLGGAPVTGLSDRNFAGLEAKAYLDFKNVFMMHLPRLCEHCLNPACVASCPSGAMYKRDEDGIVLVDQSRCRGSYLLKSEHLYFTQNGDYTIYSWDNNRIKPVVTVDFGKYSYNPTQLNEEPHAPATRNKVLSIINVKEIRSNLFFNTNKIGLFVYNKTRHQIVHAYGITNTNLGIVLHNSIATEDTHNEIVAFSYDMPILQRKLAGIASDNPVIKQIQNAKEDDNPLLFLYKSI